MLKLRKPSQWLIGMFVFGFGLFSFASVAPAADATLIQRQNKISDRYQKLEELLLRLADVEAAENPERSALMRRAVKQSRERFVLEKLRVASGALRDEKYKAAVDEQENAVSELKGILKLLMSEDRSKRIRDEKERIAKMIKDLKRIERAQRSTGARTENGAELEDVQEDQKSITERSEDLKQQMEDDTEPVIDPEAEQSESSESESSESESSESKSS